MSHKCVVSSLTAVPSIITVAYGVDAISGEDYERIALVFPRTAINHMRVTQYTSNSYKGEHELRQIPVEAAEFLHRDRS